MKGCLGKGCLITVVLAIVAAVTLFATCPKPEEHREAIREVMTDAVSAKLGAKSEVLGAVTSVLGHSILKQASDAAIDQLVHVDNYYLFSIGRIRWEGKDRTISVGILGQVITPSKEDILKEAARKGL